MRVRLSLKNIGKTAVCAAVLTFVLRNASFSEFTSDYFAGWHVYRIGAAALLGHFAYIAYGVADDGRPTKPLVPWPSVFANVLVAATIMSVFAWGILGTSVEGGDPLYGHGALVADRVPSSQERSQTALRMLVDGAAVILLGVAASRRRIAYVRTNSDAIVAKRLEKLERKLKRNRHKR